MGCHLQVFSIKKQLVDIERSLFYDFAVAFLQAYQWSCSCTKWKFQHATDRWQRGCHVDNYAGWPNWLSHIKVFHPMQFDNQCDGMPQNMRSNTGPCLMSLCPCGLVYNTVNLHWNPHNIHTIAHPHGWAMGCLLWIQTVFLIYCDLFCSNVFYRTDF